MQHWYAIHCKPRQDARAAEHLQNQHYAVFRPLARVRRQLKYCIESLFPRYLFIRLDDTHESWAPIRSTRGVYDLVRVGKHQPAVVPDELVTSLQARMGEGGWIELESETGLKPGDRVIVADGPFRGCEAIFQARSAAERVVVLLKLLGGERRFVLPEAALVKA